MPVTPMWQRSSRTSPLLATPPGLTHKTAHKMLQLLLFITFMSCTQAFIGSDENVPIRFNAKLLIQDEPNSLRSRLEALIKLKQSIKDLIKFREQLSQDSQISGPDEAPLGEDIVAEKRVFCNGFTGCGGRFRGRRVQQAKDATRKRMLKSAASKRPFCNTNGCFNGGKKKKEKNTSGSVVDPEGTFSIPDGFNMDKQGQVNSRSSKPKRLFCNGYGGCRNMGKRKSLLPIMLARGNQEAARARFIQEHKQRPMLEVLLQPNKDKRFFAASFDASMDNFVNDLR